MKLKITVLLVSLSVLITLGTAVAGPQCLEATVTEVAIMNITPATGVTTYRALLSCPASYTGSRGYYLTTDLGDSGYATLLTAMSLKQTVNSSMSLWASGSLLTEVRLNSTSQP